MTPSKMLYGTAYHEAGHAVAAYIYKVRFVYVTIEPDEDAFVNGHLRIRDSRQNRDLERLQQRRVTPIMRERLEGYVIVYFAGKAAEERHTGKCIRMPGPDADLADTIIRSLSNKQPNEINAYWEWLWARTFNVIAHHWLKVVAIAQALLSEQRLTGKQVHEILYRSEPVHLTGGAA